MPVQDKFLQAVGAQSSSNSVSAPVSAPNSAQVSSNPINTSYQFGDWITGKTAAKAQAYQQWILDEQERAFNSAEAEKNRQFQQYMDSTQVQRRMADYKAAGLNPWLAVQNLNSSTVSGSSAQSSSGQAMTGQSNAGALVGSIAGAAVLIKAITSLIKAIA